MSQYIDKDALVAEIERRIKGLEDSHADTVEGYAGEISGLKRLLSFLDTLEVKEMDVEKEKPKKPKDDENYIDLGLPSGTLWKLTNEEGYYTYDEAVEKFSGQLPTKEQWEELKYKCKWEWLDNGCGYKVTGPNGNYIFLPANGYKLDTKVYGHDKYGYYWSNVCCDEYCSYAMYIICGCFEVFNCSRNDSQSVRLVK